MMSANSILIDLDKKCMECGKLGAAESGICLKCAVKAINGKVMRSAAGQAVQRRIKREIAAIRREDK